MGTNAHLDVLYNMKVSNVQKTWTNRDVDTIRLCTQVKELVEIMPGPHTAIFVFCRP